MKHSFRLATAGMLALLPFATFASTKGAPRSLEEQVRHELVMLPFFNVFDDLGYRVDGDQVTLTGQVVRPVLKSDAENVVKKIPGVARVVNNIEVLPLSPYDDRLRWAALWAIYGQPTLDRYGMGTQPSIRIIVKNGNITLKGVVINQGDKNIAGMRANGVPGAFSVTNELRVQKS